MKFTQAQIFGNFRRDSKWKKWLPRIIMIIARAYHASRTQRI
jgi:hypothetical protein